VRTAATNAPPPRSHPEETRSPAKTRIVFHATGPAAVSGGGTLRALASFSLKTGAFIFGSGLAIVPFLRESVVHDHHWITDTQFLDAVAIGLAPLSSRPRSSATHRRTARCGGGHRRDLHCVWLYHRFPLSSRAR
jgi:chromate transporter